MTRRNKHIGIIALFVLPALFFYGTFNVVGIVRTFFYSFMDWKGISANRTFIGLGNYIRPDGQSHAEAWDEEHRIFGGKFLHAFHYVRHMLAVHPLLHDYIKGRADQYFSRYL